MKKVEHPIINLRLLNNDLLPKWYDWKIHIILNSSILLLAIFTGLWQLRDVNPAQLLPVLPFFLFWSIAEYGIHRFVLHSQSGPKTRLKKEHSFFHHGYFTHQFISLDEKIDTNRILLLPFDILSLVIFNAFLSGFVFLFVGESVAWLFFLAGSLYAATYESIHAICHLNLRNNFLNYFIDHHRVHHDPSLMSRKNFSVVFPFLDGLFGSKQDASALSDFHWKVIPSGSRLSQDYVCKMSEAFPNLTLRTFHQEKHIAVYHNKILVGGATLEKFGSLKEDSDILSHWQINSDLPATRISRLWNNKQAALPFVLEGITKSVPEKTFLYGILSLPLNFACKQEKDFLMNKGILTPNLPLQNCQWEANSIPSSEGKKLLVTYKRIGAHFLGKASGNAEDKSIRVVMGMPVEEAKIPDPRKYATPSF